MKLVSFHKRNVRGFTLVELMVSMAIMVIMSMALLYNYPDTSVRVTLINSVYSTALLIREAQVRGSAIDSMNSTLGGYGVQIKIPAIDSISQIFLFGDTISGAKNSFGLPIGNGIYDLSPIDETKSTTSLPNKYNFTKICVGQSPAICTSTPGSYVTISFTRPSPLPNIYLNGSQLTNYSKACIELQSPRAPQTGHIRSVEVYNSGMIRTLLGGCS